MSKIEKAFENGKAFIPFLTAGDPCAEKTVQYILALETAGADLVEIGIPFSDPPAEGPMIQKANIRALQSGITTEGVFKIVQAVRQKSQIPLVFLTYLNPVFQYGYEKFFARCESMGVDGIIIPDLPYEEKGELAEEARRHGVDIISMVAPTSKQRIQMIAREAEGFLYIVSSMGVTGIRGSIETDIVSMVASVREVTDIPTAVGFGISTPEQAKAMAAVSDGAIVGSAVVRLIQEYGEQAEAYLEEYVRSMKEAVNMADSAHSI